MTFFKSFPTSVFFCQFFSTMNHRIFTWKTLECQNFKKLQNHFFWGGGLKSCKAEVFLFVNQKKSFNHSEKVKNKKATNLNLPHQKNQKLASKTFKTNVAYELHLLFWELLSFPKLFSVLGKNEVCNKKTNKA